MLSEFRDYCLATYAERKPMIMDEDNCASLYRDEVGWTIHRKRAWTALLSGSHYDYIDFSINVGAEAGTEASRAKIRTWMKNLSEFFPLLRFCAVARSKQLATGQTCRHGRVCPGNRRRGVRRLPRRCSGNHRYKGQLTDSGRPQAAASRRTLRGKTLFAFQRRLLTSNLDPEYWYGRNRFAFLHGRHCYPSPFTPKVVTRCPVQASSGADFPPTAAL